VEYSALDKSEHELVDDCSLSVFEARKVRGTSQAHRRWWPWMGADWRRSRFAQIGADGRL